MARTRRVDDEEQADEAVAEEVTADATADVEEEKTSPASKVVAVACERCGGPTEPYDASLSPHKAGSYLCTPCNYRTRPTE